LIDEENNMPDVVYQDLREQMDQYSVGYPSTESGVEIKILKKLFTEDEAEMFLKLSMMLETADAVAQRIGRNPEEVSAVLERMFEKGLIFRKKKGADLLYGAIPFVVGSFEFQVKDMDRELAELMEEYFLEAFHSEGIGQNSPLRTIPVNKSIDHSWPVTPYEDVRAIIKSKKKIALAKCICRVHQGILEKGCDSPLEVCFSFGSHADYYVDKGMARYIDHEEALKVIDLCDEAGLVPQPFNSQDAGGMCNCCGDCCGILRSIKMHPKPAEMVLTNYYAVVDSELCTACETCTDRCQMDAIAVGSDDTAVVDRDRCIGCGLCVTTCPTDAVTLKMKPEDQRKAPPLRARDTIMQMAERRGKSLIPLAVMRSAGSS
jgi:NAD-dependent dihydropyrimidine dehydrogenase PreA subunit/predicted transcriptional regulator